MNVKEITPKFIFFQRTVYQATYEIDGTLYDIRTSLESDNYGKHITYHIRGGEYNFWTSDIQVYDKELKKVAGELAEKLLEGE